MKRQRSFENGAEDDYESSCIQSHPLFPFILKAIIGNQPTFPPDELLDEIRCKNPGQVTIILLDLLKLLSLNKKGMEDSELKNAITSLQLLANDLNKSQIKSEPFLANQQNLDHTGIEVMTYTNLNVQTDCITPVGRIEMSPINQGWDASASVAQNQGPSASLEVKAQTPEDEYRQVKDHPLYPFIIRAITESKIPQYLPSTNGCNKLVTLVLKDILKLIEKRSIVPNEP